MNTAKSLLKVAKQETQNIETCPECYINANTLPDTWFVEVCEKPHLVLWAKLKGFPFWPAKAMGINAQGVDVRFFGDHDRANVPVKDCFLYSKQDPNPPTNKFKRSTIADCVKVKFKLFRNACRRKTFIILLFFPIIFNRKLISTLRTSKKNLAHLILLNSRHHTILPPMHNICLI